MSTFPITKARIEPRNSAFDSEAWAALDRVRGSFNVPKRRAALFMDLGHPFFDTRMLENTVNLTGAMSRIEVRDQATLESLQTVFRAGREFVERGHKATKAGNKAVADAMAALAKDGTLVATAVDPKTLQPVWDLSQHPICDVVAGVFQVMSGGSRVETCEVCGLPFLATRRNATLCGNTCMSRARREQIKEGKKA